MLSSYKNISESFAGLGILLIDGDPLIDYIELISEKNVEFIRYVEIDRFIEKLKKCGFDKIEVIFFKDYFTKYDKYKYDDLKVLFQNQKYLVFENVDTDPKWNDYVSNEQICILLTNIFLNSRVNNNNELVRNSYISKILSENEISLGILNEIKFHGLSLSTFLIDFQNTDLNAFTKTTEINKKNANGLSTCNFGSHEIKHEKVLQILNNSNVQTQANVSKTVDIPAPTWTTEISFKNNNFGKNDPKYKEKQDQKYYRHMENYAESLAASKHYHYKIIIGSSSNSTLGKKSTKTDDDSFSNTDKVKKDDEETVKYIEKVLELSDFEEKLIKLDRYIEGSISGHSNIYKLLLRKLKLKFIQKEEKTERNKSILSFLLKEIVEDHKDVLGKTQVDEFIHQLNELGFKETVRFLNQETKIKDKLSFNNEIFLNLKYNGDKFKRTLNSKNDPRVKFKPDYWQVELLNAVDLSESALVCCPTSSGKTFICYYAMEKILRSENLNDMIVFVSPNKALANQVVAEIYTRFGDRKYPKGIYKTVYAMYMQDYKINEYDKCQILVTIPTMLETLICLKVNSPWLKNIKYVIIDEIQTINDIELGSSIEKIIQFIDCPVLGLSATISNFDQFYNWFSSIEKFKRKRRSHKIFHHERYCDLQKFLFIPKIDATEATESYLQKHEKLIGSEIGKEEKIQCLVPIHEMFAYSGSYLKKHGYSYDFHLLPTEIAVILDALQVVIEKNNNNQIDLISSCFPDKYFATTLIDKNKIKEYEKFLMENFKNWIKNDIFTDEQIRRLYFLLNGKCEKAFECLRRKYGLSITTVEWASQNVFELVENLKKNKMLPVIVFTKSDKFADNLAKAVIKALKDKQLLAEKSMVRDKTVDGKIEILRKQLKKMERDPERYAIEINDNKEKIYDLENVNKINIDDYSFLNSNKLPASKIEEEIEAHKYRKIDKIFFEAWKRGIGVHHANYHTKYRGSTEYLFRRGHLQVVFATETLALGINMPCRTVVLTKDSLNLNTMMYRQMIGRAGRRGFDTIGNIVYFGVPENKVKSFISSDLIKLKSSKFSFELVDVLQLSMLNFSNNDNLKFLNSFVKYPFSELCNDSVISNHEILRLEIIYLIEQGYITKEFRPEKLCNLVLPLRLEGCNIFMISELIRKKIFDKIIDSNDLENNCKNLMIALSYFTLPVFMNPSIVESIPKQVLLPKIAVIDEFIEEHNIKLDSFFNWAFVEDGTHSELINQKKSYFQTIFPYYKNSPKNSYIYNFYIDGNLDRIENLNNKTVTSLYYALKTMRILVETLLRYVKNYDNNQNFTKVLEVFNEKIKKRFESINN